MRDLASAHEAVAKGDWPVALELLEGADVDDEAARLELLAQARYGNGEFEASIAAWEDLHALLEGEGDAAGAARAAAMVAMFLMMDTGLMAPVRGWVRRAERLVEGHDDAPALALIPVVRAYERFMCGDMESARRQAELAIELGERLDVPSAVVIGRVCSARVRIVEGAVDEGLDLLDEVGAILMSGAADPLTTGIMYCELICAAQGLSLHRRASEWTEVMDRWRHGAAIGAISGRCRVHRAEMLRISGPCDVAEEEALKACEELRPWMRREFGWPLTELGNIRLRRGDLAGADEAFRAAHEHAWSPQPGLALLRLEQGDVDTALAMITDAIAHPFRIPSKERPPFGDLRLAPLIDALAEIAAAAADHDATQRAADSLRAIADSYSSSSIAASASLAQARASLLAGDAGVAIDAAADAVAAWTDVGAPFETAVARTVLGDAQQLAENTVGARIEWEAARATFEAFGAVRRAERAAALVADGTAAASPPIAGRESIGVFRCDGDMRTVGFGGLTVHVRDLKGYRYIHRLLTAPGREFHVLDLIAVEVGSLRAAAPDGCSDGLPADGAGSGMPLLDDVARTAYRRRLAEVDDDIEEAERMNDVGRLELAQRDREYLIAELTRAAGLAGRSRTSGGTTERARTSVARALRYSLSRLGKHHPTLAAHLGSSVNTGTYCCYAPDPVAPIIWEL